LIRSNSVRRISSEFIRAVREANPIVEVVGEYVALRRIGAQFSGRCPFHSDASPSFFVHPGKGVYRCFACTASGDVFTFVQRHTNSSFADAVTILAQRAGMSVERFRPSPELAAKVSAAKAQREEREAFRRFCDARITAVNNHYRSLGRSATNAESYLQSGDSDPCIHDLAWAALERYVLFGARVEREEMVDVKTVRAEWLAQRGNQHVAA
jgi:DNA primase catalytic core